MVAVDPGGTALARLLAVAYRSLVVELHRELRARGWHDVRPSFGFVLLAARDDPATPGGLAELLGVSKQAASKLVDGMVAAGYVARGTAPGDARRKLVELTPRGAALLRAVEEIYAELERGWERSIGADGVHRLRADLVAVLTDNGARGLPQVRPVW